MKKFSRRLYYLLPIMLILITLAALSACSAYTTQTPATTPAPTTTPTPASYTVDIASKTGIGDYLVDGKGMTLYYFTKDVSGKSNATAAIIANWPIFYVSNIVVPPSLNAADFGSITEANGNMQSTYKGWPLYYYVKDQASGDTLGQGINGVWFVINPTNFPQTSAPAPTPSAVITSPEDGSTIPAGDVTVSIQVSNFNVVDKQGQANASGEGHIHYFLDVDAPTTPGKPAIPASGVWAHVADTTHTFGNVAAGTHTISVELVNNDHTPLTPPVVVKVAVTVEAAATTPTPTPAPGQSVTINLIAQNMAFDKSTITVPAGASVTINFNNEDTIPHNFALYTNSSASTSIFVGEVITSTTTTYEFTAPTTPGNYFFRCDVHPMTMTGTFVVTAASIGSGY